MSSRALPASDEIRVWPVTLDRARREPDALTDAERRVANSFDDARARVRYVAGRTLVRRRLGALPRCEPLAVDIVDGPDGKPVLAESVLSFNISHAGEWLLIAISRPLRLGVDVEEIRPGRDVSAVTEERLQPIGTAPEPRGRRWAAAAFALAIALWPATAPAAAESAAEIMQKQRAMHRTKDEEETLLMKLVSKTGQVKERRLVRYTLTGPDNLNKILMRFLAPRGVENTGLLTWEAASGDDDQWLYLPATHKVKRVTVSGRSHRFMGTDFAFEDMQPESIRLHRYELLGSETVDGQDCHVIGAVPVAAAASGYSKRTLWVRKDNYFTVKREYHDRKGKLEKVGTERALVQVRGTVWRANELQMHDVEAGTRTILLVEGRAVDKGLRANLMTEAGLTHGGF